jgi:V/A-type H+-transporting ATPase subunit F
MKFFLISDNADTQEGMRMAGIEGVVVHEAGDVNTYLDHCMSDPDIAVVLMTEKLIALCKERVYQCKLSGSRPLIVEIPDRHGTSDISDTIARYISDAIGVSLN